MQSQAVSGGMRLVTFEYKRDELLYDIANLGYIEGHLIKDDEASLKHMTIDVVQDGNKDRVTRILGLAHAAVNEMLYPYTKVESEDAYEDNTLRYPEVYEVVMEIPHKISESTVHYLNKLIHEYLVCRALAEWMSITNLSKAEVWMAKAEEAEREIRACLARRMGRTRIKMHPF